MNQGRYRTKVLPIIFRDRSLMEKYAIAFMVVEGAIPLIAYKNFCSYNYK